MKPNLYKYLPPTYIDFLTALFNKVICLGYPPGWDTSMVTMLHKGKVTYAQDDYRTIQVSNILPKLLSSTLDMDLVSMLTSTGQLG